MNTNLEIIKLSRMETKIATLRRVKLTAWLRERSVPPGERSYFSQLKSGTVSFGEKAARRLEEKYGMGHMYLDIPDVEKGRRVPTTESSAPAPSRPSLEAAETSHCFHLQWISEKEAALLNIFRACELSQQESIIVLASGVAGRSAASISKDQLQIDGSSTGESAR